MEFAEIIGSLFTLIILEIVLGVDNLVFLSILTEKLPKEQRKSGRRWGLTFAWVTRLILLASAVWLAKMNKPLLYIFKYNFSIRDLFLLVGGAFLIVKATQEIHREVGLVQQEQKEIKKTKIGFKSVVTQIALMDIIFSLDSVLTAVGLTTHFWIMAVAITIAILVMIYASEPVSNFIDKYPSLKMLALSFLMLIGTILIADGFSFHIPRGYIYFSMVFSLGVETLNILRSRHG